MMRMSGEFIAFIDDNGIYSLVSHGSIVFDKSWYR